MAGPVTLGPCNLQNALGHAREVRTQQVCLHPAHHASPKCSMQTTMPQMLPSQQTGKPLKLNPCALVVGSSLSQPWEHQLCAPLPELVLIASAASAQSL